ncbi:MAG: iron-containing redox enzyme family protein [Pseudomonadota bacterium]
MQNTVAAIPSDSSLRIYRALFDNTDTLWPGEAADYLREQLRAAAGLADGPSVHYDGLADWCAADADAASDAYHAYLAAREDGAPRRHFGTPAQACQFLSAVAPARLCDGASLYGMIERWDDIDFQPLVASYLEQLGYGVPERNHLLRYRVLLATHHCEPTREPDDEACRGAAVELALAQQGEHFLPELLGYNLARQQPSAALLVARHELAELGLQPDAFATDSAAAGSAPSALLALRGVMQRVGDGAAFYRRVGDGVRLQRLVADVPLPQAGPGPQPAPTPWRTPEPPAAAPEPVRATRERPVIRHHFPADEHAWEAIGCELRLLEARLAASDSKEEAMGTLAKLLSPAQQHTPAGLMAARIFSQLFNL